MVKQKENIKAEGKKTKHVSLISQFGSVVE